MIESCRHSFVLHLQQVIISQFPLFCFQTHPNDENAPPPSKNAGRNAHAKPASSSSSRPWSSKPSTSTSNLPFKIHVDQPSGSAYEAEDASDAMAVENRLMGAGPSGKNADFWADKIASLPQIPSLAQIERAGDRAALRPVSVDGIPMEVGGVGSASPVIMDESMSMAASPEETEEDDDGVTPVKRFRSSSMGPRDETPVVEADQQEQESGDAETHLSEYEDSLEYCPEIVKHLCDTEVSLRVIFPLNLYALL